MSTVLASAPIGVPVIRMRAAVLYRSLDSNTHRAVADLMELQLEHDRIAAILGLRLDQTRALIAEVDGSGGQRTRMIRVWIDSAHRAVLPGNGELHLLRANSRPGVPTLPVRRPTPADLPAEAFAAATANMQAVVVDALQGLHQDRQPGAPHSDELLLPATHLLVTTGKKTPALRVQWHGVDDADLTRLANKKLVGPLSLSPSLLRADAPEQARADLYERLDLTPAQAFPLPLGAGAVEDRVLDLIAQATQQIVLALGDPITRLEPWISRGLDSAAERGVEVLLLLSAPDKLEGHLDSQIHVRAAQALGGFVLIRDADRALAHSHALLLGASWDFPDLAPQACLAVHDPEAACSLLDQLGIDPPPPSRAPARDTSQSVEEIAQDALRGALEQQGSHLPAGVAAAVGEEDLEEFHAQAERNWIDLRHPGEVRSLAAGVAWERTVYTLLGHLASSASQLQLYQFRWKPPGVNIDLDIILHDGERQICWVIDAKHGPPRPGDIGLMRAQLGLARRHELVPEGWQARGLIVHPIPPEERKADGYTERINRDITRTSIAELPGFFG